MASLFRLRGRALQIGNLSLFTLTFLTAIMLVLTVSLLPVIYMKGAEPYIREYISGYGIYINLGFASAFCIFIFSVSGAMRLGAKRFFFKKAQRKNPTSKDIFFYFRPGKFLKCIYYCLRIEIVRCTVFLLFLLPCAICVWLMYVFSVSGVSALVCLSLFVTAVCLFINGTAFYALFFSSFFLCDYYFIEGSFISFKHLIASSQKMMRKRKKLLMKLRLSFIGWFIMCIFIFPLPYVWSYYNQSLAVAAENFMEGKKV